MSNSDKLEACKKELRSLLIPYQKGIYLSQFHKTYREMIGRNLPVREFGFKTDTEFLYSMPDVVRITPTRNGDYHLLGVADEKSKHIQQMVSRQKPAKLKAPPPRFYSRTFNIPPRFNEVRKFSQPNLPQKTFHEDPVLPPKLSQRTLLKDPVLPPKLPQKTLLKDPVLPPKDTSRNGVESNTKLTLQDEVILLVQNCNNKVALDDFYFEYRRRYNKTFSLSLYDISSVEECIELIPELELVRRNSVDFIVHYSDSAHTSDKDSYATSSGNHTNRTPTPEMAANFNNSIQKQSIYEGNIPMSLRQKFQKVADSYPGEILASDFLDCFESATSESLDFQGLGYRCLSDLIDDVPDIFNRKPVAGSRKDYIIYSAKSEVDSSSLFIDRIVLNLRKILEAYSEGILVKDILNVYNINYKDSLHIEDLGFDDLEVFLSSIKNSVPLRFDLIKGQKSVHLKLNYTPLDLYTQPETNKTQTLPFDAASPNFIYKPLVLPSDFDYTEFKPVYVSAVAHPGHLYIQFKSASTTKGFEEMATKLEKFYKDKQSESYMMKSIHIKEGVSCVSKWPVDQVWYRAQIISAPSKEEVKVLYVDWGTTDTIPTNLLRYVKKEFVDVPAQAVKCRLSFLKPANNAQKWDDRAKRRILSMCHDIPLMAKFEKGTDGVYSIVLCDTNGDDDVYINDVLREEGLADYDLDEPTTNDPVPPEPAKIQLEYQHNLSALQALQAQFYLKAFAAIVPSFAQNENYLSLLRQISVYCQTPDTLQQNISTPFMPSAGPPGFDSFPKNVNPCANLSTMHNTILTGRTALEGTANVKSPLVSTADHFIKAPVQIEPLTFPKLTENSVVGIEDGDNDIFDDDDDEIFQQFCQKVSSTTLRYVKKAHLGDGYKLHIIIVESTPYASSGDISNLIWNNKEADYMYRRLQLKDTDIPAISLSEDGNEELFQQLNRFDVKGVQNTTGFKSSILLYELKNVIRILNIFGHPSVTLRTKLTEEIATFNPEDSYWQEFSLDATESDDDNGFTGATDDDKIERLCLFDLMAMKESILCKKKKLVRLVDLETHADELHKLNQLLKKVLDRIREIKEICKEYE